jgi:fructosamine-3-kinase
MKIKYKHHHHPMGHTQTNTFLGATEQSNEWGEDFARFFLERRLIPQLMVRAYI